MNARQQITWFITLVAITSAIVVVSLLRNGAVRSGPQAEANSGGIRADEVEFEFYRSMRNWR